MSDSLKQLMQMVPPPHAPFEAGVAADFSRVEATLGLSLPDDYKQLVLTYGSGRWQEFWNVLNPFTENRFLNLLTQSATLRPHDWSTLDSERYCREAEGARYPHPIYPEEGGILPWAFTDNGGRFFWLTVGNPQDWATIYYPDRDPNFQVFAISAVDLLLGAISGTLPIFQESFGSDFAFGQADAFAPGLT